MNSISTYKERKTTQVLESIRANFPAAVYPENFFQLRSVKNSAVSPTIFNELDELKEGDKILISFEYGASTMPEIHPMSVALLQHMFSKGVKVYIVALWPEGAIMTTHALNTNLTTKSCVITIFKTRWNLYYKLSARCFAWPP